MHLLVINGWGYATLVVLQKYRGNNNASYQGNINDCVCTPGHFAGGPATKYRKDVIKNAHTCVLKPIYSAQSGWTHIQKARSNASSCRDR
eukprot:834411-Pelagomonas_calceolata.AAC.1